MTSMLVCGVEHVVWAYDEETGYGATLCEEKIGRCDVGPRLDQEITCVKCREIQAANAVHTSRGLPEKTSPDDYKGHDLEGDEC